MRLGKKLTPVTKAELSPDQKFITLVIPVDPALPLSVSGKSHIVYTSRIPLETGVKLEGRMVYVNCTAFIEKIPGRD